MVRNYTLPLKVCDPSGKRISVSVTQMGERVRIESDFIKAVELDKPAFSKGGIIRITVNRKDYSATKEKLTKYLEDLFLKELGNADRNTGHGNTGNGGGNKKTSSGRNHPVAEGEKDNSLRNRSRRRVETESAGGGPTDTEMAESGGEGGGGQS